jgi:hypothetical protein
MESFVPSYPAGTAGLGLLLLRLSAALLLGSIMADLNRLAPWIAVPLDLIIVAITLGSGTRIAASLCAVLAPILLLQEAGAPRLLIATHALDVAALALLGPGAFSIDARLFGRRTIGLPR